MSDEKWLDIGGYEGYYMISDQGRVKSLARNTGRGNRKEIILKPHFKSGYLFVNLHKKDGGKAYYLHRLVAENWLHNSREPHHEQVNHTNGNKADNRIDNLEWCTRSENAYHSFHQLGNVDKLPRGNNHRDCKLSEEDVRYIRENYIERDREFGARALGRKFGVGHASIRKVIERQSWNHIE